MRRCIFCDSPLGTRKGEVPPAKEHVLPDWIQRHLGITDASNPAARIDVVRQPMSLLDDAEFEFARPKSAYALSAMRLGRVCRTCNGGWMGRLEHATSQFLKPFLEGSRELRSMTSAEREVLRRWALKTAYVMECFYANHTYIEPELVRLLMRDLPLPDALWLFGIQTPERAPNYSLDQGRDWLTQADAHSESEAKVYWSRTFKTSMYLGRLVLTVAYLPSPEEGWRPVAWRNVHQQLAPEALAADQSDWSFPFPYFQAGLASQVALGLTDTKWRPDTARVMQFGAHGTSMHSVPTHELVFSRSFDRAVEHRAEIHRRWGKRDPGA